MVSVSDTKMQKLLETVIVVAMLVHMVHTHGRLMDPPSRSSMWRKGFNTVKNYNDNELFCGGFNKQVQLGYKCGVCGDAFDLSAPRPNEAGGMYGRGIVVANYTTGQIVDITVDVTANHKGWFEFKICPTNDVTRPASQECMDQNVLQLADGPGSQFKVDSSMVGDVHVRVKLPESLTCDICVLQWRYHTGNSWGEDPKTGKGCIGCGYQEEFYGCADIQITDTGSSQIISPGKRTYGGNVNVVSGGGSDNKDTSGGSSGGNSAANSWSNNASGNNKPDNSKTNQGAVTGNTSGKLSNTVLVCNAYRTYLKTWCQNNCELGNCPEDLCHCTQQPKPASMKTCFAKGVYAKAPGFSEWCQNMCNSHPEKCNQSMCDCSTG